jgi:hypothetical protein
MGRLSALFIAFVLGAATSVALVSCGGDDAELLPGTTADQIESNLTRVEELSDEGDCVGAEEAVAEVADEVEQLQDVNGKLKAALQEGTTRLSVVVERCEEETVEEETEPTLDPDVEAEEVEDEKKPKKEKPDKDEEPSEPTEEPDETEEEPEVSPQDEEEGGDESAPPVQPEPEVAPPSGGVAPGQGVE